MSVPHKTALERLQEWVDDNAHLFSKPPKTPLVRTISQPLQQTGSQPLFQPQFERLSPDTQNLYAVPAPISEKIPRANISDLETRIVPAVKAQMARKLSYPPYTAYRSTDHPLLRLYGACIAYVKQHRHLPSMLYVSASVENMVAQEIFAFTGQPYDGRFKFFHPQAIDGKVKSIGVFTEQQLPDLLALAVGSQIDNDLVIAVGEC